MGAMSNTNKICYVAKVLQIVKKWRMVASAHRVASTLRIALSLRHSRLGFSASTRPDEEDGSLLAVPSDVPAGHLAVYVGSQRQRFVMEARLLNEPLFRALLDKAQDEFGYEHKGGITIPCDPAIFENLLCLFSRDYRSAHVKLESAKENLVNVDLDRFNIRIKL